MSFLKKCINDNFEYHLIYFPNFLMMNLKIAKAVQTCPLLNTHVPEDNTLQERFPKNSPETKTERLCPNKKTIAELVNLFLVYSHSNRFSSISVNQLRRYCLRLCCGDSLGKCVPRKTCAMVYFFIFYLQRKLLTS